MASKLVTMASNLVVMASNLAAVAAMASNLLAMASNLLPTITLHKGDFGRFVQRRYSITQLLFKALWLVSQLPDREVSQSNEVRD